MKMMKEEVRNRIEEIMAGMKCPKDFECAESGFEQLCKARVIGTGSYLDCLDENSSACSFALPSGRCPLCLCPLRIYIATNLKR